LYSLLCVKSAVETRSFELESNLACWCFLNLLFFASSTIARALNLKGPHSHYLQPSEPNVWHDTPRKTTRGLSGRGLCGNMHAANTSGMPKKSVIGAGHRRSNNAYRVGDWMTSNGILEHTKALQKEATSPRRRGSCSPPPSRRFATCWTTTWDSTFSPAG
jgi:hypothetical protein